MATWTDGQKFHGIDGWQPKIRTRNKHKSNIKNFTRSSVTDRQKQQKHKCYAMPCIEAARAVASETQRPQSQEERKILFEHLQQETQAREILRMRNSILAKNCITQLAKKRSENNIGRSGRSYGHNHNHIKNGKIIKKIPHELYQHSKRNQRNQNVVIVGQAKFITLCTIYTQTNNLVRYNCFSC